MKFIELQSEAEPTPLSLTQAEERGRAELRVCYVCGENVTIGERRVLLDNSGEVWTHPYH